MDLANNIETNIFKTLGHLLTEKSNKDGIRFTASKLAVAVDVQRSVIQRLLHPNPEKRVKNPRIDTLIRIVEFFRTDGFDISLDNFINNNYANSAQQLLGSEKQHNIPIYNNNSLQVTTTETLNITLMETIKKPLAFIPEHTLTPFFKQGTIFILDLARELENEYLILGKTCQEELLLGKYIVNNKQRMLLPLSPDKPSIALNNPSNFTVIGVIAQINPPTQ